MDFHPSDILSGRVSALLLGLLLWGGTLHAQFLSFGRNKVNYERFDWQVLKTDHFDIYYYSEMEELARIGAAHAEGSYQRLSREFNFTLLHRVPLIFYSAPWYFQQTNVTPGFVPEGVGGFFEFMKGRVVIPANGSMGQFRHVIQHELVHVFMHAMVERSFSDRGIPSERYPPLWFVEGLAEVYSSEWDSQAEMLIRDALLSGYLVPLRSILAINGTFLMYKEAQSMLLFMKQEYGEDAPIRILNNIWLSADFDVVLKSAIGKTSAEFDQEWLRSLRRRIFPLVASHDQATDVTRPISVVGFSGKPAVMRQGDSTRVIFLGNRSGYSGVYRVSLHGGEPELLLQGEKTEELEAFRLLHSGMEIWKDSLLAFVTKSGEQDRLHVFSFTEKRITESFSFPGVIMVQSPTWSPDGRRLAFSALDKGGRSDVYVMNREDGSLQRLTRDYYDDRDPAWSPDGSTIVFSSDRGGDGERGATSLFSYRLEDGRLQRVTLLPGNSAAPSWSRDGSVLTFTSDADEVPSLYCARWRADSLLVPLRVHAFTTAVFDPIWDDEGGIIVTSFENSTFQIRRLDAIRHRLDSLQPAPTLELAAATRTWVPDMLTRTTHAESPRYSRRYQLDFAQSQISIDPVFGTLGGAAVSLSDVLGDDRYNFMLYNTAQTSSELLTSFNIAISRGSLAHRTFLSHGVYHYSGRRYDMLDPDRYFVERAFGAYVAMSYPLSTFRRIETSVSITNSDKESLAGDRQRKALLLTNSVSYVMDNALYYYTGPLDGTRLNLTLSYTSDIQYSNVSYYSIMVDVRRYLRLDTRTSLAFRGDFLFNEGTEARRYLLGGSWDLRGWPLWSIRGTKRWLGSMELRFPLLDSFVLDLPVGAANLGLFRGAVFFDAGNCWDSRYSSTLGSIGAGVRFSFLGFLVLRYDLGKRIERNFTAFQDGMFHQFFFGWDF